MLSGKPASSFDTVDFAIAVEECYTRSTDPERLLKSSILGRSIEHASMLFGPTAQNADFRQMMETVPEYASDVARKMQSDLEDRAAGRISKRYKCPSMKMQPGSSCSGVVVKDLKIECPTCSKQFGWLNKEGMEWLFEECDE